LNRYVGNFTYMENTENDPPNFGNPYFRNMFGKFGG